MAASGVQIRRLRSILTNTRLARNRKFLAKTTRSSQMLNLQQHQKHVRFGMEEIRIFHNTEESDNQVMEATDLSTSLPTTEEALISESGITSQDAPMHENMDDDASMVVSKKTDWYPCPEDQESQLSESSAFLDGTDAMDGHESLNNAFFDDNSMASWPSYDIMDNGFYIEEDSEEDISHTDILDTGFVLDL